MRCPFRKSRRGRRGLFLPRRANHNKAVLEKIVPAHEFQIIDQGQIQIQAGQLVTDLGPPSFRMNEAHVVAAASKIEVAEADVIVAEAEVDVAKAEYDKYKVQLGFATISAPFDGVVTQRTSFVGDFVRSANDPLGGWSAHARV